MINKKTILLFLLTWIISHELRAQIKQDSTRINFNVPVEKKKEILDPTVKRQRNKSGAIAFVSCLFIITTTILIYNVRSK